MHFLCIKLCAFFITLSFFCPDPGLQAENQYLSRNENGDIVLTTLDSAGKGLDKVLLARSSLVCAKK